MERNSFVFYKEWRDAIKDLPNDVRLEIYEGIIEYAFSGIAPSLKPMANIAFNFIKGDIDRNFIKYRESKGKRSEAGRLGNLKRWNEDLYNDVMSDRKTLEEAEKIAKDRNVINEVAKIAVNDNVNVNDNVSNKEIYKEILSCDVEDIYSRYPARCIVNSRSTNKTAKDKNKITSLLKSKTKDEMLALIDKYVEDCRKTKTFIKNFSTFLNNLPDYSKDEYTLDAILSKRNDKTPVLQ